MFGQLSFRKKIILSQILSFILFFAALFPIIEKIAERLVRDSIIESTSELKDLLERAGTEEELIDSLKRQQYYSFFRMSLINDKGIVIYDTHMGRLLGPDFKPYMHTEHSEVQTAREKGVGYIIAPSDTFGKRFAYCAQSFMFQGKQFILRTAFPYQQIEDLTENFEIGILIFSFIVLLFFNALIWLIFNRLTRPIRDIIGAITPYQRGDEPELPEIKLTKATGPGDDFTRLASAFNLLSKRIQEQIENLKGEKDEKEAILESLGEGVIAVDENLHVLYINFIACKMLGVHRKDILDKPLPSNGPLMEHCKTLLEISAKEATIQTASVIARKEKKTYIDLVAAPKARGKGAIIVLQDKTNHYRVLEMGKDFVANASHELRTPITIIKGYTETLSEIPNMSDEQRKEITEKIGRNCERMENLVSNLLTLADIENLPESRFTECDIVTIIENCVHMLKSVYSDAEVRFEKEVDSLGIGGDAELLELALVNILDNAAKYSPPPAKITIIIGTTAEEEVEIKISDQGLGIPKEDQELIFERFYRVDKTHSRKLGGAGLGLSIVKTIITKHDGSIEVASELNKGTTFTITLPIRHHNRM